MVDGRWSPGRIERPATDSDSGVPIRRREVSETARKSRDASLGGHGIEQQEQAECAQTQEE
jgi:hypothetical protein